MNTEVRNNNNEEEKQEAEAEEYNNKEEQEATPQLKGAQHLIQLRRARVTELWAQGWSQQRIAEQLHVDQTSISLDIKWLKQQAREQIKEFVTSELPNTVAKAKVTLDLITQKLWATVAQAERDRDEKTKMQALGQIQSAELQKIEIVSNTGIVDSVISAAEGLQQKQQQDPCASTGLRGTLLVENETEEENTSPTDDKSISDNEPAPQSGAAKPLFERKKAIPLHPEEEDG